MFIIICSSVIAKACPKQIRNKTGLLRYFVSRNDENIKLT